MEPDLPNSSPPLRLVPAVDRAARMLTILEQEGRSLSLSDLARRLDASKGSVRDILETLRHHGIVDRDEASKQYRLGGRLIRLGVLARAQLGLGDTARPYLRRLAEQTGEVAVLLTVGDGRLIVAQNAEPARRSLPLSVHAVPGSSIPLLAGACGKILLALGPAAGGEPHGTLPVDEDELERVRSQGYATDDEEYLDGIRGVSAGVFDDANELVGLVLVSGLSASFGADKLDQYGRATASCAAAVSAALGAPAPAGEPPSPVQQP